MCLARPSSIHEIRPSHSDPDWLIQNSALPPHRAVAPGTATMAQGCSARLCYYRTNYGKITSVRDRLFQPGEIESDFCLF